MNNEIKEILEYLKDKNDYIEDFGISYKRIYIDNGDLKILLDYITNLQQENDNLINLVKEFENKGYDIGQERADFLLEIKDLQQENETRQQDINNLTYQLAKMKQENERLKTIKPCMLNFQECYVVKDYKSRCEKAIGYIKAIQEHRQGLTVIEYHKKWLEMYDYYESASIMADLLNILQNGSEDNE